MGDLDISYEAISVLHNRMPGIAEFWVFPFVLSRQSGIRVARDAWILLVSFAIFIGIIILVPYDRRIRIVFFWSFKTR